MTFKKLEIIIKPEKLEDLKSILDSCGAHGLMISNIMGYGTQKGYTQMYRGTKYTVNLLPKVKVETVVCEEIVEAIIRISYRPVIIEGAVALTCGSSFYISNTKRRASKSPAFVV